MGSTKLMVLGTSTSPYVNRVEVALNIKSLDYEFIHENLQEKSELLLKSNPVHKKIPVLIHGDNPITESLLIIEYIDETWTDAPSILPSDPYERTNARFWAAYIDQEWFPALTELKDAQNGESKAAAIDKINEILMILEDVFVKCSKGKAFFGGEYIGYVDIVLGCLMGWLKLTEILYKIKFLDESKTPGLTQWATKFLSHEATKNVVAQPQQLLEVLNKHEAAKLDATSK